MNFPVDPTTTASLLALLGAFIQIAKPFIQGGWTRDDLVRAASAVLGAILLPVFEVGVPGFRETFANLRDAAAQGFVSGAALTYAVQGVKALPLPSVSLPAKAADPAPPAAPAAPAA